MARKAVMTRAIGSSLRCRAIAALACLNLFACSTARPRVEPIATVPSQALPRSVRLTLVDGRVITMRSPERVGETVSGQVRGPAWMAVPVRDIASWEQLRFSPLRTSGAVVGVLVVLGALTGLYLAASDWDRYEEPR
jgi:hypothetical protein